MLSLICMMTARAQQATQPSTPAPEAKGPDYVEEKGFKTKVFEIRFRDPGSFQSMLQTLGSGFKGSALSVNRELRTITARDFPENLAVMEDAIKRLDVPEAPRPDIEFHVHVLIASNTASGTTTFPPELGDVIKQLQATLSYKNYSLMSSSIQRGKEGISGVNNSGLSDSKLLGLDANQSTPIFYGYRLRPIMLENSASGSTVHIGTFSFNMRFPITLGASAQYENVGFETPVSVRDGEKIVVGTTTMGDKGLVVVLMAKVIK